VFDKDIYTCTQVFLVKVKVLHLKKRFFLFLTRSWIPYRQYFP